MWAERRRWARALTVGVCVVAAACGGSSKKHGSPCEPGDSRACPCEGAEDGTQYCLEDGSDWDECRCAGDGVGGSPGSGGAAESGGSGPTDSGGGPGSGGAEVGAGGSAGSETGGAPGTGGTPAAGGGGGDTAGTAGVPGVGGDTAGSAGEPTAAGASAGTAGVPGAGGATNTGGAAGSDTGGSGGSGGAAAGGTAGSGGIPVGGSAGASAGAAGSAGVAETAGGGGVPASGGAPGVGGATAGAPGVGGAGGSVEEGDSCAAMVGDECNSESCCTNIVVPGGTFRMGRGTELCSGCVEGCPPSTSCEPREQIEHFATVATFALDKYEVTVGRYRAFIDAGGYTQQDPPVPGSGALPGIPGTGWDSAWNTAWLPTDASGLENYLTQGGNSSTWTSTDQGNETEPINCRNWYEAFAFCVWDGGRLPTEAEWEYAAAGGESNFVYPWGNEPGSPMPANYADNGNSSHIPVGSYPSGNAIWGHADMAGSMNEWTYDSWSETWYTENQYGCTGCVNLTGGSDHMLRGASYGSAGDYLRAAWRLNYGTSHENVIGIRCARDP